MGRRKQLFTDEDKRKYHSIKSKEYYKKNSEGLKTKYLGEYYNVRLSELWDSGYYEKAKLALEKIKSKNLINYIKDKQLIEKIESADI